MLPLPSRPLIAVEAPPPAARAPSRARSPAISASRHLDTGKLYRAVGLAVRARRRRSGDAAAAAAAAGPRSRAARRPRPHERGQCRCASIVSAHPAVRAALLARQRAFAAQPAARCSTGATSARSIAPHAPAKLFVTAALAVRAARRAAELARSRPAAAARGRSSPTSLRATRAIPGGRPRRCCGRRRRLARHLGIEYSRAVCPSDRARRSAAAGRLADISVGRGAKPSSALTPVTRPAGMVPPVGAERAAWCRLDETRF